MKFAQALSGLSYIAVFSGCTAVLTAIILASGSCFSLLYFLLFLVLFFGCVLGSGMFFTRKLIPDSNGADRILISFLPGIILFVGSWLALSQCITACFSITYSGTLLALPTFLLGAREWFLFFRSQRKCMRIFRPLSICQAIFGLSIGIILALIALWGILPAASSVQLNAWQYNQDLVWSVGNAASAAFGVPFHDIRVAGLTLHYHFLNDLLVGILAIAAHTSAWSALCWFWTPIISVLTVLTLYRVGRKIVPQVPLLSALLPGVLYLCNPLQSTLPETLFVNANALVCTFFALFSVLLLIQYLSENFTWKSALSSVFLGLLCGISATGIKSTIGALIFFSLVSALIVGIPLKKSNGILAVFTFGFGCGFLAFYFSVLQFATNNLFFVGASGLSKIITAYRSYFTVPLLLCYLASLVYSAYNLRKLSFTVLTINAFAIGGMLAFMLFSHYSASQNYFALNAVPCAMLTLLPAGKALVCRLDKKNMQRVVCVGLCSVLFICFARELYNNAAALRRGVQATLRCVGLRSFEPSETYLTSEDWEAAIWLKNNTDKDTVFATNRNNKEFAMGEGTFHFYSAVSERQCYIEAYRYSADYDGAFLEIRRRLEQVSDNIFYSLPEQEAFAMAKAEGINYLIVSHLVSNAPIWQTIPVFENQFVSIYQV